MIFENNPPSNTKQNSLVYGNEVVSTSNSLAVKAGLNVYKNNGSAADPALTAAICLTVVEPTMNSLGDDPRKDGHAEAR